MPLMQANKTVLDFFLIKLSIISNTLKLSEFFYFYMFLIFFIKQISINKIALHLKSFTTRMTYRSFCNFPVFFFMIFFRLLLHFTNGQCIKSISLLNESPSYLFFHLTVQKINNSINIQGLL